MHDMFDGECRAVLRESAVTAHADWYSKYIDRQGFADVRIEVEVAADGNIDGSNYWELFLMEYTGATPGTHTNYSAVDAADVDVEIRTAAGVPTITRDSATNAVKIDSTSEDSVLISYKYHGKERYLHVFGDVTTAGSYPTGIIGVRAYLSGGRIQPEGALTPTIGAVS